MLAAELIQTNFVFKFKFAAMVGGLVGGGDGQRNIPVTPRGTGRPSSSSTCSSAEWTWTYLVPPGPAFLAVSYLQVPSHPLLSPP
jgi:hypothetical protein